jgi:hypothetical protein
VQPSKNAWLSWAAVVVPAFATALTWSLTAGWPLVDRVAIAVAAALAVFAGVYFVVKAGGRNGG